MDFSQWCHVFKLDPAREISDEDLERVCESGTDAVLVGGTQEVTFDNTIELLGRVRRFSLPCVLEVSQLEAVVPGYDAYFVPLMLNAGAAEWIFERHIDGLMEYGPFVRWSEVVVEGYVVLNPEAEVGRLTSARTEVSAEKIKAYGRLADQLLKLPVFYIEYSGAYGDPCLVREAKSVLKQTRLFYGGGIRGAEQAAEMAQWADTVIIGNIIYENIEKALETVAAVKGTVKGG